MNQLFNWIVFIRSFNNLTNILHVDSDEDTDGSRGLRRTDHLAIDNFAVKLSALWSTNFSLCRTGNLLIVSSDISLYPCSQC